MVELTILQSPWSNSTRLPRRQAGPIQRHDHHVLFVRHRYPSPLASRYPSLPRQCGHLYCLQHVVWICIGCICGHGTRPAGPDLARRDQDRCSPGRFIYLHQYCISHGKSHCRSNLEPTKRDLLGITGIFGCNDGSKCILLHCGESGTCRTVYRKKTFKDRRKYNRETWYIGTCSVLVKLRRKGLECQTLSAT